MSQATPDLHFYLLGELRITQGGAPLVRPPRRATGLLAALLLRPRPQRRLRLAQWLFPQLTEAEGRRRLSDLLWLLRRSLPMLPLEINAHDITLPQALRWLDVEALRQVMHSQQPDDWLAALDLYRGELLTGMSEEWIQTERETLHSQFVRFLQRAAQTALSVNEAQRLTPLAERLVREEPYDETAVRILIRRHLLTGQRGKALTTYEQFAARLATDLGLEPEPETQQVVQDLRRRLTPTLDSPERVSAGRLDASGVETAQAALVRGELQMTQTWLAQWRAEHPPPPEPVQRIRFDLALLDENHDQAAHILAGVRLDDPGWLGRSAALHLERGDLETAYQQAAKGLLLAHQKQAHSAELELLLILARIHQARGHSMQALNVIDKATRLAEQNRDAAHLAEAYNQRGAILTRHSRYDEAANVLYEAEMLARRHGLKRHLAHTLNHLSAIQAESGDLMQAKALLERALGLWRDIGLLVQQAHILYNLSLVHIQMGQFAEGQRLAQQARHIYAQTENHLGLAIADYGLALANVAQDNTLAPQAIKHLEQHVLPTFRSERRRDWEGPGLALLAELLYLNEEYLASLRAADQAEALLDELGELSSWPIISAIRGLAQLALGQTDAAQVAIVRALLAVAQGSAAIEDVPLVYYAQAMLQAALHHEDEAQRYIRLAYESLLKQAEQLTEESARQALYKRNPLTRRLLHEAHRRGLAALPRGTVTRWLASAHGGEPVMVYWTVDAGASDLAILHDQGAVALRRARLQRLLDEAQAQGGQPTAIQLAAALNVSPRTIQRDLAWRKHRFQNQT